MKEKKRKQEEKEWERRMVRENNEKRMEETKMDMLRKINKKEENLHKIQHEKE